MAITEQRPHTHGGNKFLMFEGTAMESCVACITGSPRDVLDGSETPGIYRCSCLDGCSRCDGTGTLAYLTGDPKKDAPVERWLTEMGPNAARVIAR